MTVKRTFLCLTAFILCLLCCAASGAEVTAVSKEENGRVTETVWTSETGEPAAGPYGYASVRYSYAQGNVTENYFDANGKPCEAFGGFYGRRVTRDSKNRVTQIEYLDQNGQRTLNAMGYGMVAMTYHSFGEVRSVTYYGMNKQKIVVPSLGYAMIVNEYSGKTMSSREYQDAKGRTVECAEGYAEIRQKLNKSFQVERIRFDHADESPAVGPDGWYRCIKERDGKGRIISVKYYDTAEKLIDRGLGYAWEEMKYDSDSIVRVTRYDLSGQPVAYENGTVTLIREMKDDRVVKESFLDAEGKRICNDLGVGSVLYAYDQSGAIEKVTYQDTEGNPAVCSKGYAGYRDEKDELGITVRRVFLGTDGLPAETSAGYSEIRYVYDEVRQLNQIRYYDINGKQIKSE